MRKYIVIINLFIFISFAKSQVLVDSISVTPNPFIKRTSIYYCFINNDTVSLSVLNLLGNTIVSLLTNSIIPSGSYQDSLIMDAFPDGLYYVQMKLGHRKTIIKKIIKNNTAGISENLIGLENIHIYPNPILEKLTIEFNNNVVIDKLIMTNSLGQRIFILNNPISNQQIDIISFPKGIYYLQAESKEGQRVFKVLKE